MASLSKDTKDNFIKSLKKALINLEKIKTKDTAYKNKTKRHIQQVLEGIESMISEGEIDDILSAE